MVDYYIGFYGATQRGWIKYIDAYNRFDFNNNIAVKMNIYGSDDPNTYVSWNDADEWRIVVGGLTMLKFEETTVDKIDMTGNILITSSTHDGTTNSFRLLNSNSDVLINANDTGNVTLMKLDVVGCVTKETNTTTVDVTFRLYTLYNEM